ncbi:MAG: hypothetical protein ACM33U_05080 [Solirubrobacterales bacterium]|nr:hypothetical protein [Solirubrobacterales bacterium]
MTRLGDGSGVPVSSPRLTRAALEGALAAGVLRPIAAEPMARLLVAALSEAAFVVPAGDRVARVLPLEAW